MRWMPTSPTPWAGRNPNPINASAVLVETWRRNKAGDLLAPEHLTIATEDLTSIVSKIHNAGAIFLGEESRWPWRLRRGGESRASYRRSRPLRVALGVYDFVKRSNVVLSNPKANKILDRSWRPSPGWKGF